MNPQSKDSKYKKQRLFIHEPEGLQFYLTANYLVQEALVMLYPEEIIHKFSSVHTRRNQLIPKQYEDMGIPYISLVEASWSFMDKNTWYLIAFQVFKLKNKAQEVYNGELHLGGHNQKERTLTCTHNLMLKTHVGGLCAKAKG